MSKAFLAGDRWSTLIYMYHLHLIYTSDTISGEILEISKFMIQPTSTNTTPIEASEAHEHQWGLAWGSRCDVPLQGLLRWQSLWGTPPGSGHRGWPRSAWDLEWRRGMEMDLGWHWMNQDESKWIEMNQGKNRSIRNTQWISMDHNPSISLTGPQENREKSPQAGTAMARSERLLGHPIPQEIAGQCPVTILQLQRMPLRLR